METWPLVMRVQMVHFVNHDKVEFRRMASREGNAMAQLECELRRIIDEEIKKAKGGGS